jgi:hypothetical protein
MKYVLCKEEDIESTTEVGGETEMATSSCLARSDDAVSVKYGIEATMVVSRQKFHSHLSCIEIMTTYPRNHLLSHF